MQHAAAARLKALFHAKHRKELLEKAATCDKPSELLFLEAIQTGYSGQVTDHYNIVSFFEAIMEIETFMKESRVKARNR